MSAPNSSLRPGFTVWLTGLPCSGKSTLARALARSLFDRGHLVEIFDGDVVRRNLTKGLGFSREDRETNVRRIGYVADLVARNGGISLVAAISPYREVRQDVRRNASRFVEVFVDAPLPTCETRDVKGMYARARAGEMKNFTGVDDPYETPVDPDVVVKTAECTVEEGVAAILSGLERLGHLQAAPVGPPDDPQVQARRRLYDLE